MLPTRFARLVGLIDAAVFFALWAAIGVASAAHPFGAIPAILFLLVPASVLVGWRGEVCARLLLANEGSAKRAAIEGGGFALLFVVVIATWSGVAHASGGYFDGLAIRMPQFWVVVGWHAIWALAFTIAGSVHGVLLFWVNRWLIQKYQSRSVAGRP